MLSEDLGEVSNRDHAYVRDALGMFAEKFYARYAGNFDNPSNITPFASASELVAECFPFVSVRD